MEKKLLIKMIQSSFYQYERDTNEFPLKEEEYDEMIQKIMEEKERDKEKEWFEIIEDIVYEYMTKA